MTVCNVLILAQSGLVLFAKDFVKAVIEQPRLLGSLLTAMTEFSERCSGMKPTFIEMSSLAVTLVHDESVKLVCALVHDRADSPSFGRLIASEILASFVDEYSPERFQGTRPSLGVSDLKDFGAFDKKIKGIVKNSVRPVLQRLQAKEAVVRALFVTEEEVAQTGEAEVDQFKVLANLEGIMSYADVILHFGGGDFPDDADDVDTGYFLRRQPPQHLFFDDEFKETRTFFWKVDRCTLVVCLRHSVSTALFDAALQHALTAKALITQIVAFGQKKYKLPASIRRGS